jgi:hypothetical protein
MSAHILLTANQKQDLWQHLLPDPLRAEQAAFLFANVFMNDSGIKMLVREIYFAPDSDFASQESDYLELSNEARISIIKNAHRTGTSIIEAHSHPFPSKWAAAFSLADISGFQETVPHMWWRLDKRPYAAIVVAPTGFDALIWHESPEMPVQVDGLLVDGNLNPATRMTLGGHHDRIFK